MSDLLTTPWVFSANRPSRHAVVWAGAAAADAPAGSASAGSASAAARTSAAPSGTLLRVMISNGTTSPVRYRYIRSLSNGDVRICPDIAARNFGSLTLVLHIGTTTTVMINFDQIRPRKHFVQRERRSDVLVALGALFGCVPSPGALASAARTAAPAVKASDGSKHSPRPSMATLGSPASP